MNYYQIVYQYLKWPFITIIGHVVNERDGECTKCFKIVKKHKTITGSYRANSSYSEWVFWDLDTPGGMTGIAPTAIKNKSIPAVQATFRITTSYLK